MFQFGLLQVIQAEREREIELEIRRRQLLQSRDGATGRASTATHVDKHRPLAARARTAGG